MVIGMDFRNGVGAVPMTEASPIQARILARPQVDATGNDVGRIVRVYGQCLIIKALAAQISTCGRPPQQIGYIFKLLVSEASIHT